MSKDYFQDIVPPDGTNRNYRPPAPQKQTHSPASQQQESAQEDAQMGAGRSIRDISPSRTRVRLSGEREGGASGNSKSANRRNWLVWSVAAVAIVVVCVLGMFAFRNSSVDVIPRTQMITFDPTTAHFRASSEADAATGTMPYAVFTSDIEDSEPVEAQGLTHAETKSTGSITVYNDYASSPVKLIKNTRFESQNGLIFRTPMEVSVPGRKGATPGSVTITVEADKPGDQYNIAPSEFTVPGLKNNVAMYKGVYARSDAQFEGGFVGERPAVDPSTLSSAIANVRSRLASRANDMLATHDGFISFPDLVRVTYKSLPSTTEAGGGVRIHESAHVEIIAIPLDIFTRTVASTAAADAQDASITLVPQDGFGARLLTAPAAWGVSSVEFSLAGAALFVWDVDSVALAQALAGKDQSAFQAVITGFPGVQEAHARIQPFWKKSFPSDTADIEIRVQAPESDQ